MEAKISEKPKTDNVSLQATLIEKAEKAGGVKLPPIQWHYNSTKPKELGADAFAYKNEIHIASGKENHAGHEVWHMVQKEQGRVNSEKLYHGYKLNNNPILEREADYMGSKIMDKHSHIQLKKYGSNKEDALQGVLNVNLTPAIAALNLAMVANAQNLLLRIYGAKFGALNWSIALTLDPVFTLGSPAYTTIQMGVINIGIEVFLQPWFLNNCTEGQLLGMINHELAVHGLGDLILIHDHICSIAVQDLPAMAEQVHIHCLPPGPHLTPALNALPPLQQAVILNDFNNLVAILGVTHPALREFDIVYAMFNSIYPVNTLIGPQAIGPPAVQAPSLINAPNLIYAPGIMSATESGTDALPQFITSSFIMKSADEHRQHRGQKDHYHMSYMRIHDPLTNPGITRLSPRAFVYVQEMFRYADDYVMNAAPALANWNELHELIFFYFLDIARTFLEADDSRFFDNFFLRYLFSSMTPSIDQVIRLFDNIYTNAVIVGTLGVPLHPLTQMVLLTERTAIRNRILHGKSELLFLCFKALRKGLRTKFFG